MTQRILVVIGHPIPGSLNHALATAYIDSARANGADVRVIDLASDPVPEHPHSRDDLRAPRSEADAPLPPQIAAYVSDLHWAQHLVFVFPQWWGSYPAVLKAFIDRVFLSGSAFKYHSSGPGWDKLLTGKTARLITTLDGPQWFSRWFYKHPGERALRVATLWYCGVKTLGTTRFDQVRHKDATTYSKWIAASAGLGKKDASRHSRHATRVPAGSVA